MEKDEVALEIRDGSEVLGKDRALIIYLFIYLFIYLDYITYFFFFFFFYLVCCFFLFLFFCFLEHMQT